MLLVLLVDCATLQKQRTAVFRCAHRIVDTGLLDTISGPMAAT